MDNVLGMLATSLNTQEQLKNKINKESDKKEIIKKDVESKEGNVEVMREKALRFVR